MTDLARLDAHLASLGRVLLGYSGGVDSALLAVAARRALGPEAFLAVIGRSASYPAVQYDGALALARRFDIPVLEVDTHELEDPRYLANPANRCFFCKQELWGALDGIARARGFDVVIDGTNADDLHEHRPGMQAADARGVRSPLAELGWSKAQVRAAAAALDIPTWDAPASPCLSSRVAYGLPITAERLRQVEQGEAFLRALGVTGDLRVRHHGDRARLEVLPGQFERVRRAWQGIEERFAALGFASVELDPRGYRRGGLLTVLQGVGS
ncbi:MAG TPA: ATP-dependent sacrificial sulfur transferase LarE [Gemmatimonadales bacterium]|nr:ATP-dependent sacrificial sulfur transferase LarE [Gemmatimonadales bacterium]